MEKRQIFGGMCANLHGDINTLGSTRVMYLCHLPLLLLFGKGRQVIGRVLILDLANFLFKAV